MKEVASTIHVQALRFDPEGDAVAVLPKPLPVRDQAMRLMDQAIREGRGWTHKGLMWYVGDSSKGIDSVRKMLDIAQYNYIKGHGVDPSTAKIEVSPRAHYLMGGIRIDDECRTSINGLYATPECAGNFDWANRIAGSGIAATQVFGARAGVFANRWAEVNPLAEIDTVSAEEEENRVARRISNQSTGTGGAGGADIRLLRDRLRGAVQRHAGVSRDQEGLSDLFREARSIKNELSDIQVAPMKIFNQALVDILQLEAMCEIASLVAGSALLRTESRGHHFRTDFPAQDDANWLRHTCSAKSGNEPVFKTTPVNTI